MTNPIVFVEIPSADFMRAVKFYQTVFGVKLTICNECETEKMAFFSDFTNYPNIAISYAADFNPSKNGVLIHLKTKDIDATLALINANGGETVRTKTKIEAEGMGYFAIFTDSEGNNIGLYSDKY